MSKFTGKKVINIVVCILASIGLILFLGFLLSKATAEDSITQKIANEFSCGVGDVEYFCKGYDVTPQQLDTSIVMKRNFVVFLDKAEMKPMWDKVIRVDLDNSKTSTNGKSLDNKTKK